MKPSPQPPHEPGRAGPPSRGTAAVSAAVTVLVVACAAAAALLTWAGIAEIGQGVVRALWILPFLIALHLGQLFLSAIAWRGLFRGSRPGLRLFYRLRIVREGIDSLLPVAQVGGEIVGARLLTQRGVAGSAAGASVIVDVTMEVLSQLVFLLGGLAVVALLSPAQSLAQWIEIMLFAGLAAACLVLAQRFGALRVIEALLRKLGERWPALAGSSSLDGLHEAALAFYRQPEAMLRSFGLHLLAWVLGSIETWAVLHALGQPVTPLQAFAVESLGMAARSAGFAIPGAVGMQEGGFVLAAMAVGLPTPPALALSLIKRLREVSVGIVGLALWRWNAGRTLRRRAA